MNAQELNRRLSWEGGVLDALYGRLPASDIEDPQLRAAWHFLTEQWKKFEVDIYAFEAILKGKLGERSV